MNGNKLKHQYCTEYLLSDCVFTLVKNYFENIGDCSVIQKLIKDVYQRRTKNYYIFLFVVYLFGFVFPFLNLIIKAIKDDEINISLSLAQDLLAQAGGLGHGFLNLVDSWSLPLRSVWLAPALAAADGE